MAKGAWVSRLLTCIQTRALSRQTCLRPYRGSFRVVPGWIKWRRL